MLLFILFSDIDHMTTESICNLDPKYYTNDREIETSIIFDLHPGQSQKSCKTIISANDSNGFYIRFFKPKTRKHSSFNKNMGILSKGQNSTSSCPLSIVSKIVKFIVKKLLI